MTEPKIYNGLFGLDKLSNRVKDIIWYSTFTLETIIFIFIFVFSSSQYGNVAIMLGMHCIMAALLRILGISWRRVLQYLWVAPVFFITIYALFFIYIIFSYTD